MKEINKKTKKVIKENSLLVNSYKEKQTILHEVDSIINKVFQDSLNTSLNRQKISVQQKNILKMFIENYLSFKYENNQIKNMRKKNKKKIISLSELIENNDEYKVWVNVHFICQVNIFMTCDEYANLEVIIEKNSNYVLIKFHLYKSKVNYDNSVFITKKLKDNKEITDSAYLAEPESDDSNLKKENDKESEISNSNSISMKLGISQGVVNEKEGNQSIYYSLLSESYLNKINNFENQIESNKMKSINKEEDEVSNCDSFLTDLEKNENNNLKSLNNNKESNTLHKKVLFKEMNLNFDRFLEKVILTYTIRDLQIEKLKEKLSFLKKLKININK